MGKNQNNNEQWLEVNRPCICCGGVDSHIKHVQAYPGMSRPTDLRICDGCGLLFVSPRLADLSNLYEQDYYVFSEDERSRYARAFDEIKRHLDPALKIAGSTLQILEVGSAKGHLLHLLRHLGHQVTGIEISRHAAEWSQRHFGLDVWTGTVEAYAASSTRRQFDVVWCNDVLEHVPEPGLFIRSCAALLKPGGRLILDTPNGGSADVLANHADWAGYNPFHVWLFNRENLSRLCQSEGLTPAASFSYGNVPGTGRRSSRAAHRTRNSVAAVLDAVGLLGISRALKRRLTARNGVLKHRPMTAAEIDRELAGRPWFSESNDSKSELAAGCRGNNLVVHATSGI